MRVRSNVIHGSSVYGLLEWPEFQMYADQTSAMMIIYLMELINVAASILLRVLLMIPFHR